MGQVRIVFEPILPSDPHFMQTNGARILAALENVLKDQVGPRIAASYEKVVANWSHKPDIEQKFTQSTNQMVLAVTPQGNNRRIWIYVSGGAKPHTIYNRKRTSKYGGLYIKGGIGGYTSKTKPGGLFGGPGSYNMANTFRTYKVEHPGIAPREFEKHIIEENENPVISMVQQAIDGVKTI